MVMLEGDPLEDIGNTRRIAMVILGGMLLDRETLNRMLGEARATFDSQVSP